MFKLIGKIFKAIITIVIIVVIIASALGIVASAFLAPTPADYEFAQEKGNITSIEIVSAKIVEGGIEPEVLSGVDNIDAFLADFAKMECNKGLSVSAIIELADMDRIDAILITYGDGSAEVISAYGNIGTEFDLSQILEKEVYIFDEADFAKLIEKYK